MSLVGIYTAGYKTGLEKVKWWLVGMGGEIEEKMVKKALKKVSLSDWNIICFSVVWRMTLRSVFLIGKPNDVIFNLL